MKNLRTSSKAPTSASIVVLVVGVTAAFASVPFWALAVGPHVDTSFELLRLGQASGLLEYLRLVAEDNQPPAQMLVSWTAYQLVSTDPTVLRVAIGWLTLTGLLGLALLAGRAGLWTDQGAPAQRDRLSGNKQRTAVGLFGLLLAVSPATGPTLVLLRYSTLMCVAWLGGWLALNTLVRTPSPKRAVIAGLVVGSALAVSYSAAALVLVALIATLIWARRFFFALLLGMLPGVALAAGWALWAGPVFWQKVAAKSSGTLLDRVVALYENVAWLLVGPASLPSFASLALMTLGGVALAFLLRSSWAHSRRLSLLLVINVIVAAAVFGAAGIVNGNMAAPATTVALGASLLAIETTQRKRSTWTAVAALGLVWIVATAMTVTNTSVLRPFKYSNASPESVEFVVSAANGQPTIIVDIGEWNTEYLLQRSGLEIVTPNDPDLPLSIEPSSQVIVILGDDADKFAQWTRIQEEVREMGFIELETFALGPYQEGRIREALGLYNTDGFQYYIAVFGRP